MLNISGIHEGFVLDHIQAGMSLQIYHDLKLDKLDCTVAIIKNAKSNKMGKKDIIKVECPIEALDLDILGFIDHNITVNVIKDIVSCTTQIGCGSAEIVGLKFIGKNSQKERMIDIFHYAINGIGQLVFS